MEIKTKFSIGDNIVAFRDGQLIPFTVESIHIYAIPFKGQVETEISYRPKGGNVIYNEKECYTSREALITLLQE